MEKLLGGKLYRSNSITELLTTEQHVYQDRNGALPSKEKFGLYKMCQCCGVRVIDASPCVCTDTEWYQLPDGRMECIIHRQVRAIKGAERKFFDFGRFFR